MRASRGDRQHNEPNISSRLWVIANAIEERSNAAVGRWSIHRVAPGVEIRGKGGRVHGETTALPHARA